MAELESAVHYQLIDRAKYVRMRRSLFHKRYELQQLASVSPATAGRLERDDGYRMKPRIANAIHRACDRRALEIGQKSIGTLDAWFKVAAAKKSRESYGWKAIQKAAKLVGEEVFGESFSADAIVTFSGPSSLFTSLVMLSVLKQDDLLNTPVFLAQQRRWKRNSQDDIPPQLPGFKTLEGERVVVLMPEALAQFAENDSERKKRFAVLDDSITSGVVPPIVRNYFENVLHYPLENLKIACALYYDVVLESRKPNFFWKQTKTKTFGLPWGERMYFGE